MTQPPNPYIQTGLRSWRLRAPLKSNIRKRLFFRFDFFRALKQTVKSAKQTDRVIVIGHRFYQLFPTPCPLFPHRSFPVWMAD